MKGLVLTWLIYPCSSDFEEAELDYVSDLISMFVLVKSLTDLLCIDSLEIINMIPR